MRAVARSQAFLGESTLPVAVIKEASLQHNIDVFSEYCRERQLELAPHVKTTMSREIFERQSAAGAWGATVASAVQAEVVRDWGVDRVLLASQVVDAGSLELLLRTQAEAAELELYCWLDSLAGLDAIERTSRRLGVRQPLRILVELGHEGGRTGCRRGTEALELASAVAESPHAAFAGIAAFEGTVAAGQESAVVVDRLIAKAVETMLAAIESGMVESGTAVLSMGGSVYFDRVAAGTTELLSKGVTVVLRSGCYVTHDCGIYDELSPLGSSGTGSLRPALEVWGAILSTPEPGLAIANFGKRHVSFDAGLPRIVGLRRASDADSDPSRITAPPALTVTAINDHHAFIEDPEGALQVGDLVGACISHPCTTFDRWRTIVMVDNNYRQVGIVTTQF